VGFTENAMAGALDIVFAKYDERQEFAAPADRSMKRAI
jgi:hypothetical protein